MKLPVYIGYEPREHVSYCVCMESIFSRAEPVLRKALGALAQPNLRERGLYWREFDEIDGQRYDKIDGKPFSTEFSFTRFLVPHLAREEFPAADWALFCDCDFLFRSPLSELIALADPSKAAMVVMHMHQPTEATKMDGQLQQRYRRKNWSSLTLWNLRHRANDALTPDLVNSASGQWLHAFTWLASEQIGQLGDGPSWNYLVGWNRPEQCPEPDAVHFTSGTPELGYMYAGTPDERYALEWLEIANKLEMRQQAGA